MKLCANFKIIWLSLRYYSGWWMDGWMDGGWGRMDNSAQLRLSLDLSLAIQLIYSGSKLGYSLGPQYFTVESS